MKIPTKRSFALVAVILTACTFGATSTWVSASNAATPWAAAVNSSGSRLFVFDHDSADLQAYTPGTDSIWATRYIGTASSSTIVDLAPDMVDGDAVVALHGNGYVRQYEVSGGTIALTASTAPRTKPVSETRQYCGLEKADNGDLYVTSVDTVGGVSTAKLARRAASSGAWTTVTLANAECHKVSFDDVNDVVVVNAGGATFYKYTAALAASGSVVGDYFATDVIDFDVLGNVIFAGGFSWVTDPHLEVWMFDLADGSLHDREHVNAWFISAVQILTYGEVVEGMFAGEHPSTTVQAIELLE